MNGKFLIINNKIPFTFHGIPNLKAGQFAVGKAYLATGVTLNNDGSFYLSDNLNDMYELFDSYSQADAFSLKTVANDRDMECLFVGSNRSQVITYDKNGKRK